MVKSVVRYPGGKTRALNQIFSMLPSDCDTFIEPMVGGGSVLLRAIQTGYAKNYIANDINSDLIAFWRAVRHPYACEVLCNRLMEARAGSTEDLKILHSRLKNQKSIDDDFSAYKFFLMNRISFSGTTTVGGFSKESAETRFTVSSIEKLRKLPKILNGVVFLNTDYETAMNSVGDAEKAFVFLDPPYVSPNKSLYASGEFDHERLAQALKKTKHRFLMTYDDVPEIRELYSWSNISSWQLQYGMNNCNKEHTSKVGSELFIYNYDKEVS